MQDRLINKFIPGTVEYAIKKSACVGILYDRGEPSTSVLLSVIPGSSLSP